MGSFVYPRGNIPPGILNPLVDKSSPINVNRTDDAEAGQAIDALSKARSLTQEKTTLSPGPYKAVVLRVEEQTNTGYQLFGSFAGSIRGVSVKCIRAQIPEIHFMYPQPKNLHNGNDRSTESSKRDQEVIDLYPIFYPKDQEISKISIQPGDLVWVELENADSYAGGGVYTGKVGSVEFNGALVLAHKECVYSQNLQQSFLNKERAPAVIIDNNSIVKENLVLVESDPVKYGSRKGNNGTQLFMRQDASSAYGLIKSAINRAGGQLSVGSTLRRLDSEVAKQPNASKVSMHYLGLALDLINAGVAPGKDPHTDQYVIQYESGTKNKFIVWARTDRARTVFPVASVFRKMKVLLCSGRSSPLEVEVEGTFVNLTAIMKHYGFTNISSKGQTFQTRSNHMMSEWWHFEYRPDYFSSTTMYGDELKKVNKPPEEGGIESEVWGRGDYVWKGAFFGK